MKKKGFILTAILLAGVLLIGYSILRHDAEDTQNVAATGLNAPALKVIDALSGNELPSSELKGKVVFINFWASWCDPCREEMPSIEKLSKYFKDNKEFHVLTILFRDDPKNALSFFKQNGFNLPLLIDQGGETARAYGLTGVPETFIIDKKGILRKKVIGPYEWDSEEVLTAISQLIKE